MRTMTGSDPLGRASMDETQMMMLKIVLIAMFFIILISIQYTLNKILVLLKDIKTLLIIRNEKRE